MNMTRTLAVTIVASAFAILLDGCASTGNEKLRAESETSMQSRIVEGKTTKAEIRAMFGAPTRNSFTEGGLEIWTYEFSNVSADAVNFIPLVNMFGSSASGKKKELVVLIDRAGVVQRYSMTESDVTLKSGVFSQ